MDKLRVSVITVMYFTKAVHAIDDNILNYFCVSSCVAEIEKLFYMVWEFSKSLPKHFSL